jgi:hypothetical protein
MFEKEAEEWANKMYPSDGQAQRYLLMGAEFGYNKANEWHYIKDELPPENVPLNIITFDKNKKRKLWEGEYKGGNGQWWTGYFNHFIDVPYAWKEIVLPKESE